MSRPGSFSFVHAADLHLDTPVSGLRAAAPQLAELLADASLRAFDAVVDLALERGAAFVVIAGDVYDGPSRGLRAQLRFRDGLARLSAAGIASFVTHGNHDPIESGWSAVSSWPKGTVLFPAATCDGDAPVASVERDGEVIATVQGLSYATRSTSENLALRLRRPGPATTRAQEAFHVGVLHCNVEGAPAGHADYSPCSLADLRATSLDYLALGHVHQRCVLTEGSGPGDPWVVYPGNLQSRGWRPGERGAKGAYLVEVEHNRVTTLEFVACDQVRFEELACPVDDLEDLGALADRLERSCSAAAGAAGGRPLVVRATLFGAGGLHSELSRPRVLEELVAHLRDEAADSSPPRFWDSITDATAPELDLDELSRRGDFAADLIALGREAASHAEERGELVARSVAGLARPLAQRMRELLEEPAAEQQLLERAVLLALDALAAEASA